MILIILLTIDIFYFTLYNIYMVISNDDLNKLVELLKANQTKVSFTNIWEIQENMLLFYNISTYYALFDDIPVFFIVNIDDFKDSRLQVAIKQNIIKDYALMLRYFTGEFKPELINQELYNSVKNTIVICPATYKLIEISLNNLITYPSLKKYEEIFNKLSFNEKSEIISSMGPNVVYKNYFNWNTFYLKNEKTTYRKFNYAMIANLASNESLHQFISNYINSIKENFPKAYELAEYIYDVK